MKSKEKHLFAMWEALSLIHNMVTTRKIFKKKMKCVNLQKFHKYIKQDVKVKNVQKVEANKER